MKYTRNLFLISLTLTQIISPALANNSVSVNEQSASFFYDIFPQQIAQEIKKTNLNPDSFSFIVTPLKETKIDIPVPVTLSDSGEVITDINTANSSISNNISEHQYQPLTKQYSHLAKVQRTPASTMKLIPTFIAIDSLGTNFVWETSVTHTGLLIGDRLEGDLIINGSGDPKLTHEKIANLMYKVQQLGIHHIEGDIIVDSSIFNNVTKDPAAFDGEPLKPYNASPDGMLVNFSTLTMQSNRVGDMAKITYTPNLPNIKLPTYLEINNGPCSNSASGTLNPRWTKNSLEIRNLMPKGCSTHAFTIAYPDPKVFTQNVIKSKWIELGNSLTGNVRDISDRRIVSPKKTTLAYKGLTDISLFVLPLVSELSFPLYQQVYDINHHSNNVMTEQLTLSLGAYSDNLIQKNTDYPKALGNINKWWKSKLTTPIPHMTNGSGLCRDCTVTVENLNELLGYAHKHPNFSTYLNSLGIAGVSGTIKSYRKRRPNSLALGRAWIKTGTLGNVTAMAGYVKGKSGKEYSVVGIINLPKGARYANSKRPILDSMVDWVASH